MTFLKSIVGIFCLMLLSTNANAQLVWSAPVVISDSGDLIGIDLSVSGYQDMISVQGTIQFDETILEYSHVDNFALASISASSFGETQIATGLLSFSWYESDLIGKNITDNDAAFTIYFTVIGNPGEISTIELIDQPVLAEFVDGTFAPISYSYQTGSVTVSSTADLVENGLENQFRIFPNPAVDFIQVESDMLGADLEMQWFSMNGDFIKKDLFHDNGGANVISTEGLNRGTYLIRVGKKSFGFNNQLIQVL